MKQLDPITLSAAGQQITMLLADGDDDDIELTLDALKVSRLADDIESVRDGDLTHTAASRPKTNS